MWSEIEQKQETTQTQEALKGPPNTFQLKHFQVHF